MTNYKVCDICSRPLNPEQAVRIQIMSESDNNKDTRYYTNIECHVNCAIDVKHDIRNRIHRIQESLKSNIKSRSIKAIVVDDCEI